MAEEQSSADERTQDPSEHKQRKAQQEGKLSKSAELTALTAWGGGVLALGAFGTPALLADLSTLQALLAQAHAFGLDPTRPLPPVPWRFGTLLFVTMLVGAAIGGGLQPGRPRLSALAPKLSNLNPLSYFSNRFGAKGLLEYVKNTLKAAGLAGVALASFWTLEIGRGARFSIDLDAAVFVSSVLQVFQLSLLVLVVFVIFDILKNQRFDRIKLRVTPDEEKREAKEEGGDAEQKARRRAQAQALTAQNLPVAVPKADVVIVNPTHFAVCLTWSRAPGSAPVCTAKGQDAVALTIRALAAESGVPIYHHPPTARALFASVSLDQEIPPDLYSAVAAAIQFADDLRVRRAKA